jgi:outer membrane protein assembly factor BamA
MPAGETLYRGSTVKIEKKPDVKESKRNIRKKLKGTIVPKRNKFIFGQPYKVWWYVIGQPKRLKGARAFLREKLGEPPVFGSRMKATSIAENMEALLENDGFFHSKVVGDTQLKGQYLLTTFDAIIEPQYTINSIDWVSDSSEIMLDLEREQQHESLLKIGEVYSLDNVSNERARLDLKMKAKGYYYFNPNYLMAYLDSTIGNKKVDVFLNIKAETPDSAKHPYTINSITLFTDYNLLDKNSDSSKENMELYDGLIIKKNEKFTPKLFKRVVTYRANTTYNITEQNKTLNRFINLGNFKFVKNQYSRTTDSSGNQRRLDAFYYLSPSKRKSFQGQIDGFSKENRFIGTLLSLNWRNRNTFKGSELLAVKTYGGFEVSYADSLKKNNNFRVGMEASITFPKFVIPFINIKESSFFPPHTRMLLGYEWFRKQGFYTKNVFRTQYEFNWKETINKEHSFAPLALSYINASNVSEEYLLEGQNNPAILTNVYSEAILGSFYSYTTNTKNQQARDLWYFNASIDLSGNLAGLITGAKNTREKTIFNTPFAQYAKGDIELRYLKKISSKLLWANRMQIGYSQPYNNSNMLPFSKQYIIGGSNSIRGFRIRQLGPGSYLPSLDDQRYFFIIGGDYKFLINTELRIPIIGGLATAVFLDAGNIWTKDTFLFGKAGQLKKNSLSELAVAGGFGIRYDLKILLIRMDFGTPMRKPYFPKEERWVLDKIDFSSGAWRRQNLIFNIAIGYPF